MGTMQKKIASFRLDGEDFLEEEHPQWNRIPEPVDWEELERITGKSKNWLQKEITQRKKEPDPYA